MADKQHHYHIDYAAPGSPTPMSKVNKAPAGVRRISSQLKKLGFTYKVTGCDDRKCEDYLTVYGQREQTNGEATDSDSGRND
jgi:Uri superfamily endonuclease